MNFRVPQAAAGRCQLLARDYPVYKQKLGLPDFSPVSQDKIALRQIRERQAIQDILAGNLQSAIVKCSNIWASFPGNHYGQVGKAWQVFRPIMRIWGPTLRLRRRKSREHI